jgi:hypothetical protein
MPKSAFANAVDQIQGAVRPMLKERGFRVRGRSFNRITEDGLTQVVHIWMGPSDPPGTTYVPGLTANYHGLFTVNLGVYVPEVDKYHIGGDTRSWVQDTQCCIRAGLREAAGEDRTSWWHARAEPAVIEDVCRLLESAGFPFLERFSTRDRILAEWADRSENQYAASRPPRIVMAIILAVRGEKERARALLALQVRETLNPGHPDSVRKLAQRLGIGPIDG